MGFTYVIEHMEEDDESSKSIPPWVDLEYAHMRILAGPDSHVLFTSLSSSSREYISSATTTAPSTSIAPAICYTERVLDVAQKPQHKIPLEQICLLDPKAENALSPEDGDGRFAWFLFGGILGDDPPRDRTGELRALGFPTRHLGPVQMTTDTALGVTKLVVHNKIPLAEIPYIDHPTITFNANESVEMPFRYIAANTVNGKPEPQLPPGMRELLKDDLDKSFDF